jgi:hypothetical protein
MEVRGHLFGVDTKCLRAQLQLFHLRGRIARLDANCPYLPPSYSTPQTLGRLPTKTLERLLKQDPINAEPTRQQAPALERRSAWSEALAAADDDRDKIDIRDRRDPPTIEGVGLLNIRVEGPTGMSIDHSATGMFKEVNVARHVRMAQA